MYKVSSRTSTKKQNNKTVIVLLLISTGSRRGYGGIHDSYSQDMLEQNLYINDELDSGACTMMEEPETVCQGAADCGGKRTTWSGSRWLHSLAMTLEAQE
ncbi:unnamed protein product [Arctogadus glacialis]